MADLMAHWWSRPVVDELERWRGWQQLAKPLAEASGTRAPLLLSGLLTDEALQLLDEYERLFVGPGSVPCPPYESMWRQDVPAHLRQSLMGPCTEDLRRLYAELGLNLAPASGELPDHVAVEFEACAFALRSPETLPVAGALLASHLTVWLPAFCRKVAQESAQPLYQELATLTADWLAVLTRQVSA